MKTPSKGISGSHVMEKCQCFVWPSWNPDAIATSTPPVSPATAGSCCYMATGSGACQHVFPVLLVFLGGESIISCLGKSRGQWQHYLLCQLWRYTVTLRCNTNQCEACPLCIPFAPYGGVRRCSIAEGKDQALEDECPTLLSLFNLMFLQPHGK